MEGFQHARKGAGVGPDSCRNTGGNRQGGRMKRASVIVFCLAVCLVASASFVHAGGFALYEWSNRGLAMGTTGYAQGVDASVISTNPALMTKLEGQKVLVGATAISPQSSVILDGHKSKTKAKIYTVPHAYYTRQMESNENVWLGIGMFTRFGLGTHYDDDWQGRGSLQYVDVASVSMNPNVAFKFNDHLSLAVGAEVLKGSFDLQRAVPIGPNDYVVSFHTKGYGFGGNVGLHYQFDDQWAAGFTYRSPMHLSTTGSGQSEVPGQVVNSDNEQQLSATLPSSYTVAVSYHPTDKLVFEMDTVYTRWELTDKIEYTGTIPPTLPCITRTRGGSSWVPSTGWWTVWPCGWDTPTTRPRPGLATRPSCCPPMTGSCFPRAWATRRATLRPTGPSCT
jgi:long-chain fatty acid transport protein